MSDNYGINSLGVSKAVLENKEGSPLDILLLDLTNEVCDRLKAGLVKYDSNTTSLGLSQSIKPTEISHNGNVVSIEIEAEDYWKFINYGVNGTEVNNGAPNWGKQPSRGKSFHQSILEWIPKRGLISDNGDYNSLAWGIMSNIRKFGKKPKPFFTDVVNEKLVNFMRPQIEELLGRAIEINITAKWQ